MYWHVLLDEDRSLLTTFSTLRGIYRMPFGCNVLSEIFQKKIVPMYRRLNWNTVLSDSTHRRWLPGTKDHRNRFSGVVVHDTENHRLLIQKLYNTTQDSKLCRVVRNLRTNIRFYVELNNERSRWRKQKNGLPQPYSTYTPTTSRSTME